MIDWFKCNTDRAAKVFRRRVGYGGIYCHHEVGFLGGFAVRLGIQNFLHAKIMGVIYVVELAYEKGWRKLWIECDPKLVQEAMAPWSIRNIWKNAIYLSKSMSFFIGHNIHEGNTCANTLASHGSNTNGCYWLDSCCNVLNGIFFL